MTFTNLNQLLVERAREYGDKPFLFSEIDGRKWSYREFEGAVNATASEVSRRGVVPGDVVSLLLPNSAEYVIAYFACWKLGALAGPVNSLLKADEIEWVVGNSESKLLIVNSQFAQVLEGISKPEVLIFDDVAELPDSTDNFDEPPDLGTESEAIIIYTSGTTGKPKGCLLTHGNLLANARQITEWMKFGPDDRLLTTMPLFHMNAVCVTTLTALYCGGSTVVSPKFSASRFWDIIEKYEITSFGSVATMLSMLLASEPPASAGGRDVADESSDVRANTFHIQQQSLEKHLGGGRLRPPADAGGSDSLRFAMCGSAPVPAELLKRFEEAFGVLVIEGYGLSESTVRATFNPPNENRRPGSCGLPIGNEMKVFDEDDREVPDGELGEIVLCGPNIFKGYFKNPEATEKAFANGWFHTGDIGYRDADGFFYIADRKSDMIIRGGENIYPREIDDLLYTHPAIASAAAIGVPDELYGEEVAAFVVLKPDASADEPEIIEFCKKHLADYKCPKRVLFVEDIPKGPTGKLLKRELAKMIK